jgi:hypothetical protein
MKKSVFVFLVFVFLGTDFIFTQNKIHEVKLSGNAYVTSFPAGAAVTANGLEKWTDNRSVIQTYIYFSQPQTVKLSIKGSTDGRSTYLVSFQNKKVKVEVQDNFGEIFVGKFKVKQPGYYPVTLQGLKKTGNEFGQIVSFIIQTDDEHLVYVHDFPDYWARRGPSVHLNYTMPDDTIEWFYNEVTVPKNGEVIGSYYMANGFGEGYFGMQYNSEKERRILFSVWSPFDTQDPESIPDSLKIKVLRRGEDVYIGEFGNEGSGGQSFLRYNWKAGNTYKFLTQVKPDGKGNTVYTSYFFATDENRWRLIASFLRPQTHVYYAHAHSFLENFIPEQGYRTRQVFFGNQWYRSKTGNWIEATEVKFSYDATAKAGVRLDYGGGFDETSNRFYLKNGGFFSESTPFGSTFNRKEEKTSPSIPFDELELL